MITLSFDRGVADSAIRDTRNILFVNLYDGRDNLDENLVTSRFVDLQVLQGKGATFVSSAARAYACNVLLLLVTFE
jgi:hypothetical protein